MEIFTEDDIIAIADKLEIDRIAQENGRLEMEMELLDYWAEWSDKYGWIDKKTGAII